MKAIRLFGAAALALALGLGGAQATTLKQVKSHGFVRGATANEVPYGYMNADGKAEGIAPDIAAHLFEPFVTGRPEGTGLGLAIAREMISAQGATLVHDPSERGARFRIRFREAS